VGRDPQVENLWYATGHGRNGILLAAITAQVISALVTGKPVEHDLTPLSPARFWSEE
jgi:glycine oxidase